MQTQALNSTLKPTNVGKTGLDVTNSIQLDPWDIVDLLICKRGEQLFSIEFATDAEFDTWVKSNSIPIKENGIAYWSFDDRCRLINHVLAHGGILEFADGTTIPSINSENSDNSEG